MDEQLIHFMRNGFNFGNLDEESNTRLYYYQSVTNWRLIYWFCTKKQLWNIEGGMGFCCLMVLLRRKLRIFSKQQFLKQKLWENVKITLRFPLPTKLTHESSLTIVPATVWELSLLLYYQCPSTLHESTWLLFEYLIIHFDHLIEEWKTVGNIPCPRARALPCLLESSHVIPCHSFSGFCSTFTVIFEQVWKILDYHVNHSDTSIYYSFILSCIEFIFGIEILWDDKHQPHTMLLW